MVLYIIGDQRSGSTLLDYLLSWHPSAISVGELALLNKQYYKTGPRDKNNWSCHCGEYINECSFWESITGRVGFSENFETQIRFKEPLSGFLSSKIQKRNLLKFLNSPKVNEQGKQVADNHWKLYEAIQSQTGKSIIIDSSKNGILAYFLNKYKKGNIKFLLLEREIDAVAFSKLRRAEAIAEVRERFKESPFLYYLMSSGQKMILNRLLARLIEKENHFHSSVKFVDYMKLTQDVQKVMDQITESIGIEFFVVPACTNEARNEKTHAIAGSPSRDQKREIKPDLKHKSYLEKNKLINFLTGWICSRYYSIGNKVDKEDF